MASAKTQSTVEMVIAKAWSDPAFKSRLLADPSAALAGIGIEAPQGVTFRVHEDTPTERHFVLPPRPTGELSDAMLESATGGIAGQVVLQGGQKGQVAQQVGQQGYV